MDYREIKKQSSLAVWIRITADPHARFRGFSILNRELRCLGFNPVEDEMRDLTGRTMRGKFWVVSADEVYRALPEMKRFKTQMEPWFFPFEFCQSFVQPADYMARPVKNIELESLPLPPKLKLEIP